MRPATIDNLGHDHRRYRSETSFRLLLLGLSALLLAACSDPSGPATGVGNQQPDNSRMKVISGTVAYRERMLLPDGAVVTVVLEDQSRMDVAATEITRYTHSVDGAPPYPYRLVYDPAAIDDRMRYGLRARIEYEGRLMFTTTQHIDPFAGPPGEPVAIIVTRVGGE